MPDLEAVVLGGSIAGLCAARVLADRYDHVTVVDRDVLPATAEERAGVPQARHVHALLIRGRRELEALFPGFDRLMLARGAHDVDFLQDFASLRATGWWRPQRSGLRTLFASRALLESVVRERLGARANVTVRERTDVVGLTGDRRRVTGVQLAARDGGHTETLAAHLVVDACGRASHAPAWLDALGCAAPAETVVDSHAAYATRWYRAPTDRPADWWWKGIWIDPKDLTRDMAGVLFPVEGGRWIVTLAGGPRVHPPHDVDGFTAALGRLRSPLVAEAVARAEPLSGVFGNREMANRFRHYERWSESPAGFVAVGDAACKFNPVYGQGMTSAALAAGLLADAIDRSGPTDAQLPRTFFAAQAHALREPWSMATGADFRFPDTQGRRPPLYGLSSAYMDALFATVTDDPTLRQTVGEVIHMLRPASALFMPGTAARVAWHAMRGLVGRRTDGDPRSVPLGASSLEVP